MILDAVTLSYLLNRCAGPVAAPGTMAAIVSVESGKNPWAIHDNANGKSYYPATYSDAVAVATKLNAQGHANLDLGIAQVNENNLARYRLPVEQALRPCTNLTLGSLILRGGWRVAIGRYGTAPAMLPYVISGAVQSYNSGSLFGSPAYANRVTTAYFSRDVRAIEAIAYGMRPGRRPMVHRRTIVMMPELKKKKPAGAGRSPAKTVSEATFAGVWNP
jgi:hypothetical protein